MDYNPYQKGYGSHRQLEYDLIGTFEELQAILAKYPNATIVNSLAHEPYITEPEQQVILAKLRTTDDVANWKRVKEDDVPIIDEFGFHVYLRSDIDFYGTGADIDYRYNT
jgi:hypothetical protein